MRLSKKTAWSSADAPWSIPTWLVFNLLGGQFFLFGSSFGLAEGYKMKNRAGISSRPVLDRGRLPTLPLSQYHRRGEV